MTTSLAIQANSLNTMDVWEDVVVRVKTEYLSERHNFPWIIGFSGGKDSTLVLQAVFEALLRVSPSKRTREIHVVSNDTLVESPLVISHLDATTKKVDDAAKALGLPLVTVRTYPAPDKTFWVLLIGKGYPSPNMSMRWCTDRLKIVPTGTYIKNQVSKSGSVIIVLGVRSDESRARSRSIAKHRNNRGSELTEHDRLSNAFVYRPIVDLSLDEVWEILGTNPAAWGGDHSSLIQLYRDSEGGECPVVLSSDEAPGCGTSNSRFGCWTCTVVEKDKSLQGFIDSGKTQYEPLVSFRDWLKSIRNSSEMRQAFRRNGRLSFDQFTGKHIPGPFTIQARQEILRRLLEVQEKFGASLIQPQELDAIKRIWADELIQAGGVF
jgi:DNA sulfur modification protein DndC